MTEHMEQLLRSLEPLEDVGQRVITFMDGQTERAVCDTGRAMISLKWAGNIWFIDDSREVMGWTAGTRAAYETACDRLERVRAAIHRADANASAA